MTNVRDKCMLCSNLRDGCLQIAVEQINTHDDMRRESFLPIQDLCCCGDALYSIIKHYGSFLSKYCQEHNGCLPSAWKSKEVKDSVTQNTTLHIVEKLVSIGFDANYVGQTETALMAAVGTYDENLVHFLLTNGSDPNLFDGQGQMNALSLSIILNNVELVNLLLSNGAKANEICCCNMRPLQLCMNKKSEISKALLQHGAAMHQVLSYQDVSNRDLVMTPPLFQAILKQNVCLASILLEHGESINETYGNDLDTPIHTAIKQESHKMIRLLINHGANLDRVNGRGNTPFGLALSTFEDEEIPRLILSSGCSLSKGTVIQLFQKDYPPLHISAFQGKLSLVKFILEECVPKQIRATGSSILHSSDNCSNFCSDELIKQRRQSLLSTKSPDGATPLYMAVYGGYIDVAEYLIEQGSDPDIVCYHGNLIHAAVLSSPKMDIIKFSLKFNCNINMLNTYGNTPLLLSARINRPEVCEVLMHHGALLDTRDSFGETSLSVSVYFGCIQNAGALIQHGANVAIADARGTTPLYWSIFNNRESILKLLLLAGANFSYGDFLKYPRNIKVMRNSAITEWIYDFICNPRSLQNCCVLAVREVLKKITNGCSIVSRVMALPTPPKLRKMLVFGDWTVLDEEPEHCAT